MKVISANIGKPAIVCYNGKEVQTGYFKTPADTIWLKKPGVKNDAVADKEHHGGEDKACYLFGYNHYEYWLRQYPETSAAYGLFGENITLDYLDESEVKIGDILQIGEAVVQVTQPRQPCFKMGIRFNSQQIVKEFRLAHTPGIYVRVMEEGSVKKGDLLTVIKSYSNAPSVLETFRLIYDANPNREKLLRLISNEHVAARLKSYLINKFNLQ